ncbi:putative ATP-binding surface antigen [Toxoplasma gondii VAND]|uniref:Putative ATP-binding surface antigen n=1 Tax=Toxoplasma gondii VAND TaxID=933077 RepID=A0A086Q8D4_TOXGO|nr:putative ATP-binding surface antigen [Toxoplasma gondii VAND]
MASPALSSPWHPTFSRLISLPLVTSPPHNTAPVTLLQWRRDASSSSGMYDQSWRTPGPMPPAALVGFTSLGVGVTIVASYEVHHNQQWSSGENGIFSSDASWLSDPEDTITSRTAAILVDVVDLGTTRPVANARIEILRGSLSLAPTENKDTTKRAHDGVSRSPSSGDHRSAEEDGASNSAFWFTDDKGFVRIPLPPSVHPFDPLYVVVTASRHTWLTHPVGERGRSLKSTPTSDLFSPLQDEAALDGQNQTGNVKRGEGIGGNGLHKLSSNGGSSSPSGISTYTSSDKEKNFRGNDPVERHHNKDQRGSPKQSSNVRRGINGHAYVGGPYFIPGNPGQQRIEIEDAARRRAGLFFHRSKVQETIDGTISPKRFDDVSAKLARFSYERQQMEAVLFSDKLVYAPGETLTMIGFISVTGADACRMSRDVKSSGEKRNENEEKGNIKTEPLCLPHWSLGLDFATGRNTEGKSVQEARTIGNNRSDKEREERLSHTAINERFFSNDLYVLLTFRWSEEESRYPLRKTTTAFPRKQPSTRSSASPDTSTSGRATGGKETESQAVSEMPPSCVAALSARTVVFDSTQYLVTRNSRQQATGVVMPLIAYNDIGANLLSLSAASVHQSTAGNELEEEAVVSYRRPDEEGIRHTGNTEAFSDVDHVCSEFLVPLSEHGSFSVQFRIPRSATQRILKTPAVRIVSLSAALELKKDEDIHMRNYIRIHDSSPNLFSSISRGRKEASNFVRQLSAAEESGEPQGDDSVTVTEEKVSPPLLCAFDSSASSLHMERRKRSDIIPVKVRSFSRPVLASPRLPSVQFVPPVLLVSPVVAPQGELEAQGTIQRIGVELRTGKEATGNNYSSSSLFLPSITVTLSLRIQRRDVRRGDALPSFPQEPRAPLHRSPDFPRSPAPNEIPPRRFSSTADSQAKGSSPDNSDFVRSSPREASSIQPVEQPFYFDPFMQVGGREQEASDQQVQSLDNSTSPPQSLGTGTTDRRTGHAATKPGHTSGSQKNADSTEFSETHSPVCTGGCRCLQNAAEDTEWSLVTLQPEASISFENHKERLEATPEEVNHHYRNKSTEFVWSQGLRTCPEGSVKMSGGRGSVDITDMRNASNVTLIQSCRAIPLRSEAAEGSKITATKNWERSCVMSTPVDSYPYLLVTELCVGEAPSVENTGKTHTDEGDGEQEDGCDHSSGSSRDEKEKGSDGAVSREKLPVLCEKKANRRNVLRQEQGKVVVPPRTGVREWGCYVDCVVLQATEKTLDTRKVTVMVHTDKTHYDVGEEVILSLRNPFGPYSSIAPRSRETFSAQTLVEATSASETRPSGDSESPLEETSEPKGRNPENLTNLSKCAVSLANALGGGEQVEIPSVGTEQQSETSDRLFCNVKATFVTDIGKSDGDSTAEEASNLDAAVEVDPSPLSSVSHCLNTREHNAPTDGCLLLSATSQQVGIPDNRSPPSNTPTIEGWNWSARLSISWLTKSATTISHRVPLADNRKTIFRLREDTDATRTPKKDTEACSESGKPKVSVGVGSFVDTGLTGRKRTEAETAAKAAQAAGLITVSAGTVPFECRYTATCKLRLVLLPPLSQERLPLAGLELNTNYWSENFTDAQASDETRGSEAQKKDSRPDENRSKDRYHQETIYPNAEAPIATVIDEGNHSKERRENWLVPEFGPFFIDQEIYINVKVARSSSIQLPSGVLKVTVARGGDDSDTERKSKETKHGEKKQRVMPGPVVDGLNKTMNQSSGLAPQKYQGKHTTVVISVSVDFNILLKEERKSASIDRTESPAVSSDAVSPAARPEDIVPHTIECANTQYNTTMSTPVILPQESDDVAGHTHDFGLPTKVDGHPDQVRASKGPLRSTIDSKTPCSVSHVGREYAATIYLILTDQRLTHLRGPGDRVANGTLYSPAKIFSRAHKTSVRSSLDVRAHTSSSSYHNVHDLASYSGHLLTSEALHSRLQFDPWIGYTIWPLRPSDYFDSDVSCGLLTCMRDKYSSSLTSGGMSGKPVSKRDRFPSPQTWNFDRSTSWLNSARSGRETVPEERSTPRDWQADIGVTKATAQQTASSEADYLYDNVTVDEIDEAELAKLLTYESRHASVVRLYKVTMHEQTPTGSMEGSSGNRVDGGAEEMSMVKTASLKLTLPVSETAAYVVSAFAVVVKKDRTPVAAAAFPIVTSEGDVQNWSRDETSDRIQERGKSAVLHSQEVWYDYQQAFLEENILTAPDSIIHLSNGFPPFLRHGDVAYVNFGSDTMFCSDCPASVAKCARNCAPADIKLEAALPPTSNRTFWCWNAFPDSVLEVTHYFETNDSEQDQRKGLRSSTPPTKQQKNEDKTELYTSTERSFNGMSCSQRLRIRVNDNVARGGQSGSVQESVIAFLKFRKAGRCTKLSKESEWEGAVDSVEATLKSRSLDTKGPLSAYCTGNVTASVRIPVLPSEFPTFIRKIHLLFPHTENASTSLVEASINSSLTNLVTDTAEGGEHVDISSLRYSSQLLVSEEAQEKSSKPNTSRASFTSVNHILRSGDVRAPEEASALHKKQQQPTPVEPEVSHLEGRRNAMAGHDETLAGHKVKDAMNEGTPSSVTRSTALDLPFSPLSQQQMGRNEAVDNTNAEPAGVPGPRTGNHQHTAGEPATTTLEDFFYVPGALDLDEGGFSIEARMGFVAAIERRVLQLIYMHKSTLLYCENSFLRLSPTTSQQADVGGLNESERLMRSAETLSCDAPESNVTVCKGAYESVDDQGKTRVPSLSIGDGHQTFRGESPLPAAEVVQEKLEDLPNSSVLLSIILAEKILSSFDGKCNSVGVVKSRTLSSDTFAGPLSSAGSLEAYTNTDFSTAQAAPSSSQNSGEHITCTASIMNMRAAIRTASQAAVHLLPLYVPTETASGLSDEVSASSNNAFRKFGLLERPIKQYFTVKTGASNPVGSQVLKDFAPKEPDLSLLLHAARVFRIIKRKDSEQPALSTQSSGQETIRRVEKAVHQAINNYMHARTVEWAKRKTQSPLDVQSGNRSLSLVEWIGLDLLAEVRFSLNATHSFGLSEENECLLGFENIFLNAVQSRTLLSVSEMKEGDQSNGTLLELPALLLAAAPASALPNGDDPNAGDHDAAPCGGRHLTGQRHMTLEFNEHAVPLIRSTSEPIVPSSTWQETTIYSPLSMDRLRARIIEESLRRLVFSRDGMYVTVATTERVGPFPRSVLPLRSHALLLRLWCGEDSFWQLPRSRLLWYMANSVADSDNAGPLLARQSYQRNLGRNSISGGENLFIAVSEEKDLSIVLEALDLLHERLSPRRIRSEPVNIQLTIRAMPSSSSSPLHEKMRKSPSRDENQVDMKFAQSPFLSGHREYPSPTADKKVPPFFTSLNVTLCGTNGHGLRALSRRDISWRELMDWREGISLRVGNMSATQATERSINTTNTYTMYWMQSVVSGPAVGLAVFLSAVYRPLHHMQEAHASHPVGTSVSGSSASDSNSYQKINRFWRVFDRHDLRCAGALRSFNEKELEGADGSDFLQKGYKRIHARQYICISIALELDATVQ